MKQISKNIIGYIFHSCSLSSSSSNTMGFSTDTSINKSSNVVREKGVSMPGLNTVHVQLRIFTIQLNVFDIGYLIAASVQVLSPHTGEYFVSHLHCSLLGLSDWHSWQMIIQEILPLRQQQLPRS